VIGSSLLRYRPEQRFIIADKESEGLHLYKHRPWEVAYLICDAKQVYERVVERIWWPDLNITRGAAIKTRFDYNDYKATAKPAAEVLARYEERLYDTSLIPVGHNFYFDGYMHTNWRRELGKREDYSYMSRMLDTHCLFKARQKGWKPELDSYEAWQWRVQNWREKGLKSNLGFVCKAFGIPYDENEAHAALYDIDKTREVLLKTIWEIEV
jgi:hypothetical protein